MPSEAQARIAINHLLEEAGWRFLPDTQGRPADIGGYYSPDPAKTTAVMRPSTTFNAALALLA